mmetsp:Transcript_2766/g.9044  ORF Transcript_2766/g.9044 Transcript_2766/m.9044 type:complete len:250 (+) Transcript_2766:72-821(+)
MAGERGGAGGGRAEPPPRPARRRAHPQALRGKGAAAPRARHARRRGGSGDAGGLPRRARAVPVPRARDLRRPQGEDRLDAAVPARARRPALRLHLPTQVQHVCLWHDDHGRHLGGAHPCLPRHGDVDVDEDEVRLGADRAPLHRRAERGRPRTLGQHPRHDVADVVRAPGPRLHVDGQQLRRDWPRRARAHGRERRAPPEDCGAVGDARLVQPQPHPHQQQQPRRGQARRAGDRRLRAHPLQGSRRRLH